MAAAEPTGGDDRHELLSRRLEAHALDRPRDALGPAELLLCGFQHSGDGTAWASLAVRSGWDAVRAGIDDGELVTVMSLRGAPHVHRRSDVGRVRAAMTTGERGDLEAACGPLPDAAAERADPVGEVAAAMGDVFESATGDGSLSKADLSSAVTPRLAAELAPFCGSCDVHHPIDGLFRLATLRAWLALETSGRTQSFWPMSAEPPVRPEPDVVASSRTELAAAAARVAAPLDRADVAVWFGWHPASVSAALDPAPDTSMPAPPADGQARRVRLLPARDPWLRGTDRDWLLGANRERRGEVFRSLGAPGVVLVGGEIAGTWRQRRSRRTLDVEITAWDELSGDGRDEVDADAALVARSRDLEPRVVLT